MRVHSNIAEFPQRRLAKRFSADGLSAGTSKAVGISAPTLKKQVMGKGGKNGVVSFFVSDGGNQVFTLWQFHEQAHEITGNGWVANGANSAEYQKTCDQMAIVSFTATEDGLYFIQAGTTPCTECWISGQECDTNPNTDTSLGKTH